MNAPAPIVREGARAASEAEIPFGFDEIFFSRTDPRGVIQAGNATFRRVSGFAWDRLIGAPHRVVRNPATPRGVFHLMWERIKAGTPTAAYVRNRAEDGRGYWVIAVVVPLADGYLSVRIKPGSATFARARALYEALVAEEGAGLSPADSAQRLQARLAAAGSPSYDVFQADALSAELVHRATTLGLRPPGALAHFVEARDAMVEVEREVHALRAMFEEARHVSINLRVLASSLGEIGRPVSAISSNYSLLASDMTEWLETRVLEPRKGFGSIRREIVEGLFLTSAAQVLAEMAQDFARHPETGGADPAAEAGRLQAVAAEFRQKADAILPRVTRATRAMEAHVVEMRRHVTGLSSIRMLCRIEGAALGRRGGSLDRIVEQLDSFQDALDARLGRISGLNLRLQAAASAI